MSWAFHFRPGAPSKAQAEELKCVGRRSEIEPQSTEHGHRPSDEFSNIRLRRGRPILPPASPFATLRLLLKGGESPLLLRVLGLLPRREVDRGLWRQGSEKPQGRKPREGEARRWGALGLWGLLRPAWVVGGWWSRREATAPGLARRRGLLWRRGGMARWRLAGGRRWGRGYCRSAAVAGRGAALGALAWGAWAGHDRRSWQGGALGGGCGAEPGSKRSMTIMRPPQWGQG